MTIDKERLESFILTDAVLGAVKELAVQARSDRELFQALWEMVRRNEAKLSWRSAWILDHTTEEAPELLDEILPEIYKILINTGEEFDGTVRHLLRFVLRRPILEEEGGYLIDKCMNWLMTNEVQPAIKVHSLEYLYNIYELMPDFKNELTSVVDACIEKGGSAGFLNRLGKVRKRLM